MALERGLAAVTMHGVAAAAGTSVGNLYVYFADRDSVRPAVADEVATDIERSADRTDAATPPNEERVLGYREPRVVAAIAQAEQLVLRLNQRAAPSSEGATA